MTQASNDSVSITNPEQIRALAHPIRLALLDYLAEVPEATATECAEHVGESVASASFHLHTLAKYGFIERAEPRGREKPWRALATSMEFRPDDNQSGSRPAVQALASLALESEYQRLKDYLARVPHEPEDWIQASNVTRSSFWATSDEAAEISKLITELTDRFEGRNLDPSLRPAGARRVRIFATLNPDEDPAS